MADGIQLPLANKYITNHNIWQKVGHIVRKLIATTATSNKSCLYFWKAQNISLGKRINNVNTKQQMRVKAKLSNTNIRKGKRKKDMRCLGQYTRALTLLQKL